MMPLRDIVLLSVVGSRRYILPSTPSIFTHHAAGGHVLGLTLSGMAPLPRRTTKWATLGLLIMCLCEGSATNHKRRGEEGATHRRKETATASRWAAPTSSSSSQPKKATDTESPTGGSSGTDADIGMFVDGKATSETSPERVKVHLLSVPPEAGPRHASAVVNVPFCVGCPIPGEEGSLVRGLRAALGPKQYDVVAEVVYAVPNDCSLDVMNAEEVRGRVAVVNRGGVAMVEKVRRVQAAGAVGVIIIDHAECDEAFNDCGFRAGSARLGGYAPFDSYGVWKDIIIPSVLVTATGVSRMKSLMPLDEIHIKELGRQLVDAFDR